MNRAHRGFREQWQGYTETWGEAEGLVKLRLTSLVSGFQQVSDVLRNHIDCILAEPHQP